MENNFIAITEFKSRSKWQSKININSKTIHLGRFNSEKEAALAYNTYLISNNLITYNRPLNVIKEDNV